MADKWIGVDFDGTLAKYSSWKGADHAGAPIKKMVDRVKKWLADGKEVRIFTARVGPGTPAEEKEQSRKVIDDFCEEHFGQKLKITATKDQNMEELWDDRAVEVEKNTGEVIESRAVQLVVALLENEDITPEDVDATKVGSWVMFPFRGRMIYGLAVFMRPDGYVQVDVPGWRNYAVVDSKAILPADDNIPENLKFKVDPAGVVRHILETDDDDYEGDFDAWLSNPFADPMPTDPTPVTRPALAPPWPEFDNVTEAEYEKYLAELPVIYVDDIPYRLDDYFNWIIPLRDKGQPRRWNKLHQMYDYLEAHTPANVDFKIHAHRLRDTEKASIPMADKEAHVVYRSGNYAFLRMPEDEEWIRKEGVDMQHCLAFAQKDYCARMRNAEIQLYSMTDVTTGIPVVDIELALTRSSYGGPVDQATVTQLRGIRNECPPRDRYLEPIADFLENYGKDWKLTGVRSFDGQKDGEEFLKRLKELRSGVQEAQEDVPVVCPACRGNKVSNVTGQSCTVCDGIGSVSAQRRNAFTQVKSAFISGALGMN